MEDSSSEPVRESVQQVVGVLGGAGVAGGLLLLMGRAYWTGYYDRMGLPDHALVLDATAALISGFHRVVPFLFAVAIAAGITAVFFWRAARLTFDDVTHTANLLPYAAIGGLFVWAISIWELNHPPLRLLGLSLGIGPAQLLALVTTAVVSVMIIVGMTGTLSGFLRHFLGATFTGRLLLVLLAVLTLVSAAETSGRNLASDQLWNLATHHEITVQFENGTRDEFFFVAHHGGFYYLRDIHDIGGRHLDIIVVPDAVVHQTVLRRVPATS